MTTLECPNIVFRAVQRSRDMPPEGILAGAFIRYPKDIDGLSIDVVSPRSCVSVLNKHFGAASLHVGRVRTLSLDAIVDQHPHGLITGLPFRDVNPTEAEHFADSLAEMARYIAKDDVDSCQNEGH